MFPPSKRCPEDQEAWDSLDTSCSCANKAVDRVDVICIVAAPRPTKVGVPFCSTIVRPFVDLTCGSCGLTEQVPAPVTRRERLTEESRVLLAEVLAESERWQSYLDVCRDVHGVSPNYLVWSD